MLWYTKADYAIHCYTEDAEGGGALPASIQLSVPHLAPTRPLRRSRHPTTVRPPIAGGFIFSPEYRAIRNLAYVAIVAYPLGIPTVYGLLLFACHKELSRGRAQSTLARALRFLYREYAPAVYWWELVIMAQKVLIVGLLSQVIIPPPPLHRALLRAFTPAPHVLSPLLPRAPCTLLSHAEAHVLISPLPGCSRR